MIALSSLERLGRHGLHLRGFQSRWVDAELGRFHVYEAAGRGSLGTFVLLHGIGSSATAYGKLLVRLRPHATRVLAPDAPGHGFSEGDRRAHTTDALFQGIAGVVDRLLDAPAVVVGTSLGGAIALRYALERPEKVRRLVLCSPAGARLSPAALTELVDLFEMPDPGDGVAFVERLFHRPPWFRRWLGHQVRAMMTQADVHGFLRRVGEADLFSPEQLASLTVPTLLIWGQSEKLLPPESLDYFRAHLPPDLVRFDRPAGYGHSPHLEQPADLSRRIVAFARG